MPRAGRGRGPGEGEAPAQPRIHDARHAPGARLPCAAHRGVPGPPPGQVQALRVRVEGRRLPGRRRLPLLPPLRPRGEEEAPQGEVRAAPQQAPEREASTWRCLDGRAPGVRFFPCKDHDGLSVGIFFRHSDLGANIFFQASFGTRSQRLSAMSRNAHGLQSGFGRVLFKNLDFAAVCQRWKVFSDNSSACQCFFSGTEESRAGIVIGSWSSFLQ